MSKVDKPFIRNFKWCYVFNKKLDIPGYGRGKYAYDLWLSEFYLCYPILRSYQHRSSRGTLLPSCGMDEEVLARINCWLTTPDKFGRAPEREDNSFETVWGGFGNSAIVYKNSDNNVACALIRQTCESTPGHLMEAGVSLPENQRTFLQSRRARRLQASLLRHCSRLHDLSPKDFEKELIKYALNKSHAKYRVRRDGLIEVFERGMWSHKNWMLKNIRCKLKKFERAKPGKYPRLIGDMGVVASLVAGFALDMFKDCMSTYSYSSKKRSMFVKSPSLDVLKECFDRLVDPVYSEFVCHSDDSCFSVRCIDGIFMCNLDIASCDASHTGDLFRFLIGCVPPGPWRDAVIKAVEQVTKTVSVVGASNSKINMRLAHHTPGFSDLHELTELFSHILPSGSTLTTAINTLANILINQALSAIDWSNVRMDQCPQLILEAARRCGYVVTIQVCTCKQQLQFLKHSPNSQNYPWMNLGVMARTIGHCFGPAPGPGTFRQRASRVDASLVAGMVHCGDSRFYRSLVEKHGGKDVPRFNSDALASNYTGFTASVEVTDEDILARYQFTHEELREKPRLPLSTDEYVVMCDQYKNTPIGYLYRDRFSDRVLNLDYGYKAPTTNTCCDFDIDNAYPLDLLPPRSKRFTTKLEWERAQYRFLQSGAKGYDDNG